MFEALLAGNHPPAQRATWIQLPSFSSVASGRSNFYASADNTYVAFHGGIAAGGGYTGTAGAYSISAKNAAQNYVAGSANAFGAGYFFNGYAVYAAAIWDNGIAVGASYGSGSWIRTLTSSSSWSAMANAIPTVSGYNYSGCGITATPSMLYMMGGFNYADATYKTTNAVWMLNSSWTWALASYRLPYSAAGVSAAAIGNKVYVIGGTDGQGSLKNFHVLDTSTNTFTKLKDLPAATSFASAYAINNQIVLLGENPTNIAQAAVYVYDTRDGNWYVTPTTLPFRSGYCVFYNPAEKRVEFFYGANSRWGRVASNIGNDATYATFIAAARYSDGIGVYGDWSK